MRTPDFQAESALYPSTGRYMAKTYEGTGEEHALVQPAAIARPGQPSLGVGGGVFDGGLGFSWCKTGCGAAYAACTAGCTGLSGGLGVAACLTACTVLHDACREEC